MYLAGGASSTTFHAGTSIDFAMSIDTMVAFDQPKSVDWGYNSALSTSTQNVLGDDPGPGDANSFAGNIFSSTVSTSGSGGGQSQHSRNVKTSLASTTHDEYSISFDYDISTSTDPRIAGHPSDVIVGGGVDLVVSEALKGTVCNVNVNAS